MWPRSKYNPPKPISNSGLMITYACVGAMLCLIFVMAALGRPNKEPTQVGPANNVVNRGGRIVAVQFPALSSRVDRTTIFDHGLASRQFVPSEPDGRYSRQQLTPEQRQAIEDLRIEWCRKPPRSVQPYYYDIGFQCSAFRSRRVLLPQDALPPVLATLLETLPAPQ